MSGTVKIRIDLATRRHRRLSLPLWVTAALAACALLYTAYNAYGYFSARSFIGANAAYLTDARVPPPQEALKIREQAEAVNSIIMQKTFSWTKLLTRIEESVPRSVTVVDIAPETGSGAVEIRAMAESFDDAMAFVEAISKSGHFGAALLKEHSVQDIGGTRKIVFGVHAVYKGGA